MKHILRRIVYSVIYIALFAATNSWAQSGSRVIGRVVDGCGKPVPHARVLVFGPEPQGGMIGGLTITDEQADADGHFKYEIYQTKSPETDSFLYVTSPIPLNAFITLTPPFNALRKIGNSFLGLPIHLRPNQEVNIGDVKVQVIFGVVVARLQDRKGLPMFDDPKDWEYVGLRIRDIQGRIVEETEVPPASAKAAVRANGTSLAIVLPEGVWQIEIGPNGLKGKWIVSDLFLVKSSVQSVEIVLNGERNSKNR